MEMMYFEIGWKVLWWKHEEIGQIRWSPVSKFSHLLLSSQWFSKYFRSAVLYVIIVKKEIKPWETPSSILIKLQLGTFQMGPSHEFLSVWQKQKLKQKLKPKCWIFFAEITEDLNKD